MVAGSTHHFPGFLEQILHGVEPGLSPWVPQLCRRQGGTSLQVLLSILGPQLSRSELACPGLPPLELPHPAVPCELQEPFPSQLIPLAA